MLHRLRHVFEHPDFKSIVGDNPVEIDETYYSADEKNKHADKKVEGSQGRSTKTKKPILGMKERGGNIIANVVPDTKGETIMPIITEQIKGGTRIYTDEYNAYKKLNKKYLHETVNHGAKEYVNQMAHVNGVENFWSHLKRGVDGIYHWASKEHLQSYVDEFSLRYNTRERTTSSRFDLILANVSGRRITYKQLISR